VNFNSSITLAFKDAFSSGFTDAKNNLAGMKGALDEIGQNNSMTRLAADMAMMTSMTEPMRKALSQAMDQPSRIAGTLDSSFRTIQVGLGATNKEMETTRRELLAIGGQAAAGPAAVADAFANVATGVADASKHMAIMNAAVSLAEANQADLGMSTNAMINVMNAWNLSSDNAAIAADVLTQASYMGVGSLDEFAGSISHISALAASAGIGLGELGSSMAYATTKGMNAGQAQKQLKGIISTLISPSESLSNLYAALGVESGQAMIQQYGLAESLGILKDALGGDEQAFASIIGSAEAAAVALALTEDQYLSFAASFGEGMAGVTEAARGVQLESIEMKMARLDAVSQSLQAQVGQDINSIKGFFIDMKFGFLSNVVSPLMASPVGGALSKIAAGVGMGAKGILDFGSGAMATAAQMTTLAANIHSVGGIAKLFHSSIGLAGSGLKILSAPLKAVGGGILGLGKSIIGALPAMGGYISSMWAAVAPTLAAALPILAIVAGVALLAAGVYLLIKHWDKVSGFFGGLWAKVKGAFSAAWDWIKNLTFGVPGWVLTAVAAFFPFIGIPALIIKHWDGIKNFFGNLWSGVTGGIKSAWNSVPGFFSGILDMTENSFSAAGSWIKNSFSAVWDWIKNSLSGVPDWVLGAVAMFMPVVGVPALIIKHWDGIKSFFTNLFNDPKAAIQSFIDWLGGKIDGLIAPFRLVGDVVGGTISKIGGFFKGITGGGEKSGSSLNDAFASGIQSNSSAPATAFGGSLAGIARQMPHSDAAEGPLSELSSSGRALTETFASGMDGSALREKANLVFSAAMPRGEAAIDLPVFERNESQGGSSTVHIQNLYLQADDCQSLFDFIRMIMHSVNNPVEAPV
jgi:TP901 family phage tail tape measure protein